MKAKTAHAAAENQLDSVRESLAGMSKEQWALVAQEAKTTERTLYNVMHKDRKPSYDTVYRIYAAIKCRAAAAVK